MPTVNQLVRGARTQKKKRKKSRHLEGNPQLRATVLRTFVLTPCKPNSASRHACRVRMSNGMEVTAYLPGRGMRIQEHSNVLIRGGKTPDLRGVKYKVVRGALDCGGVDPESGGKGQAKDIPRKNSRSLYGVPRK